MLVINWLLLATCLSEDFFTKRLTNALGYADRNGVYSLWWDLTEGLEIDEVTLPIRFHLAADFNKTAQSCLGIGWSFPLFESAVISQEENIVLLLTPGGNKEFLIRDGSKYTSLSGQWLGNLVDNNTFKISDEMGCEIEFIRGRVHKFKNKKAEVVWRRHNTQVASIIVNGKEAIKAQYNKDGLLSELRLYQIKNGNRVERQVAFSFTKLPMFAKTELAANVLDGAYPTLGFVEERGRETGKFEWGLNSDTSEYAYRLDLECKDLINRRSYTRTFSMERDGVLIADDDATYDYNTATKMISRRFGDGSVDSYIYDPSSGVMRYKHRNGFVNQTTYILQKGVNYQNIRKQERFAPNGHSVYTRLLSYDLSGNAISETLTNSHGQASSVRLQSAATNGTVMSLNNGGKLSLKKDAPLMLEVAGKKQELTEFIKP